MFRCQAKPRRLRALAGRVPVELDGVPSPPFLATIREVVVPSCQDHRWGRSKVHLSTDVPEVSANTLPARPWHHRWQTDQEVYTRHLGQCLQEERLSRVAGRLGVEQAGPRYTDRTLPGKLEKSVFKVLQNIFFCFAV